MLMHLMVYWGRYGQASGGRSVEHKGVFFLLCFLCHLYSSLIVFCIILYEELNLLVYLGMDEP